MYCPGCGKETDEGNKFCRHCGMNLVKPDEKPLASVIPPGAREKPKPKTTGTTTFLLVLLGIRLIANVVMSFQNPFALIDVAVYLVTIIGVGLKARWGSALAIGYHALATLTVPFALVDQGFPIVTLAIALNFAVIGLAWSEYRRLKDGERKTT